MKEILKHILCNPEICIKTDRQDIHRIAGEVLPELLTKSIRLRNADDILAGRSEESRSFISVVKSAPYLLRRPGEPDPIGVVRFSDCQKADKEFLLTVKDYLIFEKTKRLEKFDEEKMQMFSVVYRAYDSWGEKDTDGEYTTAEEIRKAVKNIAEREFAVAVNIEHEPGTEVNKTDARIIELYQARTDWYEEGLEIRKGDLVSTTQFYDTKKGREFWKKLKAGEYTTYSMEGAAR